MDSGPLRPVPTRCLKIKIDVFLFLMHYNTTRSIDCNGKQCIISDRLHNYYITCFSVGLLLLRLPLRFAFAMKL